MNEQAKGWLESARDDLLIIGKIIDEESNRSTKRNIKYGVRIFWKRINIIFPRYA